MVLFEEKLSARNGVKSISRWFLIALLGAALALSALLATSQPADAKPSLSKDGVTCTPCHTDGRKGTKATTTKTTKPKTTTTKKTTTKKTSTKVAAKPAPAKPAATVKVVDDPNLVHIREVAKTYGGTVTWDKPNKAAVVSIGALTIAFPFGQAKATVGGKDKALPHATNASGGRTMVSKIAVTQLLKSAAAGYVGSGTCAKCHAEKYNNYMVSGHPWKLQPASEARLRPLPLPTGLTWDDISYVIGGYKWKARFIDKQGYIITKTGSGPGKNQYNLATGTWGDYEATATNKKYDCGKCHTTGYSKEGNQDGLPGIVGTWAEPGIGCEACHGPGAEHAKTADKTKIKLDKTAALCGKCHIRGSKDSIPASGGFIQHHEQYNEMLAGPHKAMDCVACHDPHKKAEFSIKKDAGCASCHSAQATSYEATQMAKVGVKCIDCHMPAATKSAVKHSSVKGDVKTHIFKINTGATVSMFSDDKTTAFGFVTLDFACLSCHKDKDTNWAAGKAANVH